MGTAKISLESVRASFHTAQTLSQSTAPGSNSASSVRLIVSDSHRCHKHPMPLQARLEPCCPMDAHRDRQAAPTLQKLLAFYWSSYNSTHHALYVCSVRS